MRVFFAVLWARGTLGFLVGASATTGCSGAAAGTDDSVATVSACSVSVSVDKIHSLSRRVVNPVN
ncbi:hypothetical protein Aglo01_21600 [Actinokineospora globicatena]|uniref:Uncharacterized protein n=1 Tax=Actinokineospora globicatena TaxID=103729 RepID=A0A9W6VDJ5_9PSEU|nr:hypothetical protein Aglo01_21600 [Actinokineospora globicatena]GLW95058.1 hypothetical protein Aglo03_58740 [Actinokineospora globicatena]